MTRGVLFRHLRHATTRILLAMLSAYLGAVACWFASEIFSPADPHLNPASPKSLLLLFLASGFYGAFALRLGNTGLLIFLGLTLAIRNLLPWRNRLLFVLGSTLAGFLGILLGPMPALWRFPQLRPTMEEWPFYLLGTSIGLVSGCIFLLLALRAPSRIQETS